MLVMYFRLVKIELFKIDLMTEILLQTEMCGDDSLICMLLTYSAIQLQESYLLAYLLVETKRVSEHWQQMIEHYLRNISQT